MALGDQSLLEVLPAAWMVPTHVVIELPEDEGLELAVVLCNFGLAVVAEHQLVLVDGVQLPRDSLLELPVLCAKPFDDPGLHRAGVTS